MVNRALVASLGLMALALPLAADALTDAELEALFAAQRRAIQGITEAPDPALGQSRGLGAARGLGGAAEAGATRGIKVFVVEPDTGTVTNVTDAVAEGDVPATPDPTEADATLAPVTYTEFASDLQHNLQIRFDHDSASLREAEKPKLRQLCRVMAASGAARFRIIGHTDASGPDLYNAALSRLRATEVQRYFVDACDIAPSRLEAIGMGERFPLNPSAPNAPENRRVEFQAIG